jgi:septum site-determining protein MinC
MSSDSSVPCYELKSADLALVALILKTSQPNALASELSRQLAETPDFFDQDPLLLDLSQLPEAEQGHPIDFKALVALLKGYKLVPLALKGGSPEQMAQALQAGLVNASDARIRRQVELAAAAASVTPVQAAPAEVQAPVVPAGALVVDKPLRSGQQVYAKGRDLVVMAMVNPGAEVIADGHIHIYAPLRGKAIAGARGQSDARIFALAMEPELISIAGVYRTSENPLPAEVWGKPAQVSLQAGPEGDKLTIAPLKV